MISILSDVAVVLYFMSAMGLFLYGLNCYVMIHLFKRKRKEVSDSVLEIIYGLITERGREKRSRTRLCEDEDGYTEL